MGTDNEPRVPAGSPEGGQWTKEGFASGPHVEFNPQTRTVTFPFAKSSQPKTQTDYEKITVPATAEGLGPFLQTAQKAKAALAQGQSSGLTGPWKISKSGDKYKIEG